MIYSSFNQMVLTICLWLTHIPFVKKKKTLKISFAVEKFQEKSDETSPMHVEKVFNLCECKSGMKNVSHVCPESLKEMIDSLTHTSLWLYNVRICKYIQVPPNDKSDIFIRKASTLKLRMSRQLRKSTYLLGLM